MFDENDDDTWRKHARLTTAPKRFSGQYLTASQYVYLGRQGDRYAYIAVQSWFKRFSTTVVSVLPEAPELPAGYWEEIPGTGWDRYVVCGVE